MRLYGFLSDSKFYEDLGHILIGLVPFWGWIRERKQLPPENDRYPVAYLHVEHWDDGRSHVRFNEDDCMVGADAIEEIEYWAAIRVHDIFRDNLGYAIGGTIRTAVLVGLLIWRW